jgi:hypothetical protein
MPGWPLRNRPLALALTLVLALGLTLVLALGLTLVLLLMEGALCSPSVIALLH